MKEYVFVVACAMMVALAGCGGGGNGGAMDGPAMPVGDDDPMVDDGGPMAGEDDPMAGDGDPVMDDDDPMAGVELLTPEEAKARVVDLQREADSFLLSPYYSNGTRFAVNSCQGRSCTFSIEGRQVTSDLDNYQYDPASDVGNATYEMDAVVHGVVVGKVSLEFFGTGETGDPYHNFTHSYGGWLEHGYFEVQRFVTSTTSEGTVSYGPLGRLGVLFGTVTGSNPLSGSAAWRGAMVGADASHDSFDDRDTVRGDADVTMDLADTEVDVAFTNIRNVVTDSPLDDISWQDVPVVDGRFEEISDVVPTSYLSGTFLGPEHEEVGGVFEHGTLVGAFGAKRH